MTKFQTKGTEMQYEAMNKEEANKRFNISCNICSMHNLWNKCDNCPINAAHELCISMFSDKGE